MDLFRSARRLLPLILLGLVLTVGDPAAAAQDETPSQYGTPYAHVPDPKDVVIYQVNIRAFSAAGDFAGVEARLDNIRALGVNVLYLLPVYPVGVLKSRASPYCVQDYTAVNRDFGTLADLRRLVEEAHQRNMAVILDWVANHTAWDNPWIVHKSWYLQDAAGNILSPPRTDWTDVAKLNFNNREMRQAMIAAMKYWVLQANIDGYRCDAADMVPGDFWHDAIDSLRAIPSHHLLMFAEGAYDDLFPAGFQLKYGMIFYNHLVGDIYRKKGSVRTLDAVNKSEYLTATPDDRVVRYITNHDMDVHVAPIVQLGGKEGSLAAFVVAAYMKGVPMIYNGQEVGCPVRLSFSRKNATIDWTINPDLTARYQKLIAIWNGSEAIREGRLESFSSDDVCVFTKTFKTDKMLVVANLRNAAESYAFPSPLVGTAWENALDGSTFTVTSQLNLQPYRYLILKARDQAP